MFDDVNGVEKSCFAKSKKGKKWKKNVVCYHCKLICVSPIHGSLRCLKILYIHNCWNLLFCPWTILKLDNEKLQSFKIDFFYQSVTSPFALKLFLLPFTTYCSTKNIVFIGSGTSSNLCNQAPLFTELRLSQATW